MIYPSGSTTSPIMLVGEYPTEQDLRANSPFIGGAGYELTKMLQEAGTRREHCFLTLVCRERASSGIDGLIAKNKTSVTSRHTLLNGKWVTQDVIDGIEKLKKEIALVKPNVVVAFGNLALFALTGEWGVNSWRSSIMESTLVPGLKVIPAISPAMTIPQWSVRPLIVHDLKRAVRQSKFPEIIRVDYSRVIRPSYEQAKGILDDLIVKACAPIDEGRKPMPIAADIETRAGHIACIAIAWSGTESLCIPFMCVNKPEGYWTLEEEATLVYLLLDLFRLTRVIGQNWNYDAQYIYRHWHFLCPNVTDTMIQQHSCFSNMDKNLSFLSSMYLEDHLHWKDDRTNWTEGPKGEGEDQFWRYNCTDALRTFAIEAVLAKVVSSLGLTAVNDFQQALAPVVLATMNRGIRVDNEARAQFSMNLLDEIAKREEWMRTAIGREINIKSPLQMKEFFYEEMGVKPVISKKTKNPTTDDEALHRIAEREPILKPVTRKIAELRSLGVFHSTFVQAPLDLDGRIRTSFNICGTETYRFASSKNAFGTGLNCQNIPKGGGTEDDGLELPNVRQLFIPDPGHTFFDIDLDSADLRIVTFESDCKWMKEHFKAGRKPYIEVMREYYKNPEMTKNSHPREYGMFKALCHGTNYLGTASGLAPRLGLLVHEVERIQKWYFSLAPEIAAWQGEIKAQVVGRRYVQNAFGYRMYFFDRIEGTIFNQAVAWIPQSTVGCLINRAYMNIHNNLPEVEVLLQVHDSLAGQFHSKHGDWAKRRIVEESQIVIPYSDPLIIPVGIVTSKESWGACD